MATSPIIRGLCLFLYYGVFRHLPASNRKYTGWIRSLRRTVCKQLFRSAGKNINVEKDAFFGSGKKISIGHNSGIGVNCEIIGEVFIGDNVMIGQDVLFITTTHDFSSCETPMIEQGFKPERPIFVFDDVWIGSRSIILPGVTIGHGSIVGAGSVVTKSIESFSIVAGNPAKLIKRRMYSISTVESAPEAAER